MFEKIEKVLDTLKTLPGCHVSEEHYELQQARYYYDQLMKGAVYNVGDRVEICNITKVRKTWDDRYPESLQQGRQGEIRNIGHSDGRFRYVVGIESPLRSAYHRPEDFERGLVVRWFSFDRGEIMVADESKRLLPGCKEIEYTVGNVVEYEGEKYRVTRAPHLGDAKMTIEAYKESPIDVLWADVKPWKEET
jgi:hypothetical protein